MIAHRTHTHNHIHYPDILGGRINVTIFSCIDIQATSTMSMQFNSPTECWKQYIIEREDITINHSVVHLRMEKLSFRRNTLMCCHKI